MLPGLGTTLTWSQAPVNSLCGLKAVVLDRSKAFQMMGNYAHIESCMTMMKRELT